MNYVIHFCRNKKCNNGWIDKDLLNSMRPPSWKYCRECAQKLGIDFDAQTPTSNLTPEEIERRNKRAEKAREVFHKNATREEKT